MGRKVSTAAALGALAALAIFAILAVTCNNPILDAVKAVAGGGSVADPVFSQPPGTYNNDFSFTLSCPTEGTSMRYTVDGSTPRADYGAQYQGTPIPVTTTTTFKAVAYRSGGKTSNPVIVTYTMAAADPVISPDSGFILNTDHVTLSSATVGASMRYTTNGTDPSPISGTLYSGSFFTLANTATLRAIAYKPSYVASAISENIYTIDSCSPPTFSPNTGTYDNNVPVTMSTGTPGASIKYTTDGSDPTVSGTALVYSTPVTVSSTGTVVRAYGYHSGIADSSISSATYTLQTATPAYSPGAGSYVNNQSVTISSATAGVSIRYRLDGIDPTSTVGTVYSGSASVTTSSTLKAIAYKANYLDSAVQSAAYTLTCGTPAISPAAGSYSARKTISITTGMVGATIRYTTDGSTPTTTTGTVYSASFVAPTSMTVRAIAYKTGCNNSTVASSAYVISNYVWAQYDSGTKTSYAYGTYLLSSGKVLMNGYIDNTSGGTGKDLLIARFNADGSLDTTFGVSGAFIWNSPYNKDDTGWIIGVDTSDRIYIMGAGIDFNNDSYTDGYVMRLTAAGALDTSYASIGYFYQTVASKNVGYSGTLDPATGTVYTDLWPFGSIYRSRVYKYSSSGVVDATFNSSTGYYEWTGDGWTNYGSGLTFYSNAIYGSTYSFKNSDNVNSWGGSFRLTTGGALDTSFGTSGWAKWPSGTPSGANAGGTPSFLSTGKMMLCGRRIMGGAHETGFVARYSSAGVMDTTFATSGTYVADTGFATGAGLVKEDLTGANYFLFLSSNYGSGSEGVISKITNTGSLVTSFGASGYKRNSLFLGSANPFLYNGFCFVGSYNSKATIVYVEPNGQ